MLQSNYIGFLLNLKEVCVISYSKSSIVLSLPQKYHICSNCKHKTIPLVFYSVVIIFYRNEWIYALFFCKKINVRA